MLALHCAASSELRTDRHCTRTCPQLIPHCTGKQWLFFSFPFDNLPPRKYGGVFFSKSILTHSYQLQCWQRARGTCSVGLNGWWLPSYFCQRKARADYSSVAKSSSCSNKNWITYEQSFLREHGFARRTAPDI